MCQSHLKQPVIIIMCSKSTNPNKKCGTTTGQYISGICCKNNSGCANLGAILEIIFVGFFYLIHFLPYGVTDIFLWSKTVDSYFWTNFTEFGSVLSYDWSCGGVTQRSIAFSCGYCYFFIKGSFNNYVDQISPNFY